MKMYIPDKTTVVFENQTVEFTDTFDFEGGFIRYELNDALKVSIKSEMQGVSFIYMRWNFPIDKSLKVLGDAWERGYGDLEWKPVDKDRKMPWYMLISNGSDSSFDYTGRRK